MSVEPRVLERHGLPQVPACPAPWALKGNAFIIMLRLPPALRSAAAEQLPADLRDPGLSGVAMLMYVDYAQADCGPYRELLLSPGSVRAQDGKRFPSISRIVVSTYESVVNGRANWGIPKDQADFTVEQDGKQLEITVAHRGQRLAQLQLSAHGPRMPMSAALLPQRMRTIVQHWDGREFRIALNGSGQARYGKVQRLAFDGEYFPNLGDAKVIGALQLTNFQMAFPQADITALATAEPAP